MPTGTTRRRVTYLGSAPSPRNETAMTNTFVDVFNLPDGRQIRMRGEEGGLHIRESDFAVGLELSGRVDSWSKPY